MDNNLDLAWELKNLEHKSGGDLNFKIVLLVESLRDWCRDWMTNKLKEV